MLIHGHDVFQGLWMSSQTTTRSRAGCAGYGAERDEDGVTYITNQEDSESVHFLFFVLL